MALDELDWQDEIRQALEFRTNLSPDGLTGLEANLRFGVPENMHTQVFGRLSAWQNWIFIRPNAVGATGALKVTAPARQLSLIGNAFNQARHSHRTCREYGSEEDTMINYTEKIPNNVDLGRDRVLQRASEHWQPALFELVVRHGPERESTPMKSTCAPRSASSLTAGRNSATSACPNTAGGFSCSRAT